MLGVSPLEDFCRIVPPAELPTFADVGGMDAVKQELQQSFGLMLAYPDKAAEYKISWNGVLLYGPPGTGKTFLARATAGEFGLTLVEVSTGSLVTALLGSSARNVTALFEAAVEHTPALIFFDEIDSIAQRRSSALDSETSRTITTVLQCLEQYHSVPDLVIMGATNALDSLDDAIVRPGRFDRHVRVDLPDEAARAAIFAAQLHGRPAGAVDLPALAQRTAGLTAAAIERAVEAASLAELERSTTGASQPIDQQALLAALADAGGRDRPTVEDWSWDDLVLAPEVKRELQQLELLITRPEKASALGIDPPAGVLLAGPPGTGKTTVAKVLAAQAGCSFYPVSAADLLSKWVGESEASVQRLFARARDNAPSIVFIDEIDALGAVRGSEESEHSPINELLAEIDGMGSHGRVLVVAATNRPELLDPALVRGGRLSRTIVLPLPDEPARQALLALQSRKMPLADVDLAAIARRTDGFSGADLEALCQQAAVAALTRDSEGTAPTVIQADFELALAALASSRKLTESGT
jgi:transitional endoplasmic reticulum ATPase